ncbi:MAG: metallophosphoesterase [Proteobacteria bacterium]|nr:metallophosphoesterase [Pseudomonadota bacterium]
MPVERRERARHFAIGDPQAPLERFFAILDRWALLDDTGWLQPDVALISMGDYFDWGGRADRLRASASGLALLAWLAAHPRDQVTILLGNHELGRVGELASFADENFAEAHALAVEAYRGGNIDVRREAEVLDRFPALPTIELAARDFSTFSVAQRELVTALLRAGRLRAAAARGPVLFCHAGVTLDDIEALGLDIHRPLHAGEIADALNRALDERVAGWAGEALDINNLHRPGDREYGEGRGIFYHRPSNPAVEYDSTLFHGTYRRRYDPRRLPLGVVQVIGHINDRKCRQLLGPWADDETAIPGMLRHLTTDGASVRYTSRLPEIWPPHIDSRSALMIFTDGQMNRTAPDTYELLDISAWARGDDAHAR